jgi:hypothetical protein
MRSGATTWPRIHVAERNEPVERCLITELSALQRYFASGKLRGSSPAGGIPDVERRIGRHYLRRAGGKDGCQRFIARTEPYASASRCQHAGGVKVMVGIDESFKLPVEGGLLT